MIDDLFSAAIALCVLVGGTLAIGTAWSEDSAAPAAHMAQPASDLAHATVIATAATTSTTATDLAKPALR
jgi:hypothetical protein